MRTIRGIAAAAAAGSLAVLGLGLGIGASGRASASVRPAATRTVAIQASGIPGRGYATYRPGRFNIFLGGPILYGKGLHWSSWTSQSATGRGTLVAGDSTVWTATVTLHFSHPLRDAAIRYFNDLHIIGGRGVAHYWHWSFRAGNWAS